MGVNNLIVAVVSMVAPPLDCNVEFIHCTGNADSGWFSIYCTDGDHFDTWLGGDDLRDFHSVLVYYENTDYDVLELEFVGVDRKFVITRKQGRKLITDITELRRE